MVETTLHELLARNERHVASLPGGYFDDVIDGQAPAAVSICCSDSRVSQEGMWAVDRPGWLFTPSTIGNQVWDWQEGERVIDGSVQYPLAFAGTEVTLVVGHTGCGAITAALETVNDNAPSLPAGVAKWIDLLVPVVEDGLADGRIGDHVDADRVDQLVEYNVDRQVEFLLESGILDAGVEVYGFVYDFQKVYGDTPGRAYLVNANGNTRAEDRRALVPDEFASHVKRLLQG